MQISKYGPPAVLKPVELPIPQPQSGEVLVRAHATSVNPIDAITRRGSGLAKQLGSPPLVLGWDISGTVEALGQGVSDLEVGDAVYGMVHFPQLGRAYAEYVAAPADHLAHKPKSLNHTEAAAVTMAALSAWQALEAGQLQSGQNVLIHSATGGIGHFAVQMAKARGAQVWALASDGLEFLSRLGADHPINYIGARWGTRYDQTLRDMDLVFNPMPGETQRLSLETLKPGGHMVALSGLTLKPKELKPRGVQGSSIQVRPSRADLEQIAKLCDDGKLKPHLSAVLPLSEVVEAHKLIETGKTRGKIVLQVV